MKKLKLLLAAGTALTGYVIGNKKLRDKLKKSKNANDAFGALGSSIKEDTTDIYNDIMSHDKVKEAKKKAEAHLAKASKEAKDMIEKAKKSALEATKSGAKSAKKAVKKGATTAKKKVSKAKKTAKKGVKKA